MVPSPKDIATKAATLDEDHRETYLREVCAGNDELRTSVERILQRQESVTIDATDAHHDPSVAKGRWGKEQTSPSPLESNEWIGGFRVIRKIGEGAMGVVLLAEQQNPKREVALKVLRPDAMNPARERRFEFETESLARLRHAGIATIYESGNADVDGVQRPYFAMEYIEGVALDEYTHDLDQRQRVEIFRRICDAIDHAHSRGVVHRDLKPANIVVDPKGRSKVLDFGVATSVETGQTKRELVGTLPYMSPEQLSSDADIDWRADIYSLGIMLCEILTGERPHNLAGKTIDDAQQLIREEPTIRDEMLGAELSAIIRQSIAIDREDRYASVSHLNEDLGRYLNGYPVHAMQGGVVYRGRKFITRNKGLVLLGVLACVLAIAGVVGVSYQAARATKGWRQAELETTRAELALDEALAHRRRAESINRFMIDMLVSADPESTLGEDLTVLEMLNMSAQTLETELRDHPDIQVGVRMALANTYRSLGRLDEAEKHARIMVDLCEQNQDSTMLFAPDALRTLAIIMTDLGKLDDAGLLLDRAQVYVDALDDPIESAKFKSEYARMIHGTGDHERSLALWTECELELEKALGKGDKEVLIVMHNRGSALKDLGRFEESESVMREVLDRRLDVFGPDHPQTMVAQDVLAGVIQKQGRNEEASTMFRDVVERRTRVLGVDHFATLLSMGNLGTTLILMGELDEAEALTRTALDGHRARFGNAHSKTLILMGNLAYLLEDRGRLEEAAELYREVIDLSRNSSGGLDPETWAPANNLAMLLMTINRADEADPMFIELLTMCEQVLPANHYYTAIFRNNHAECLTILREFERAQDALEKSHPVLLATFGPENERVLKSAARIEKLRDARSQTDAGNNP